MCALRARSGGVPGIPRRPRELPAGIRRVPRSLRRGVEARPGRGSDAPVPGRSWSGFPGQARGRRWGSPGRRPIKEAGKPVNSGQSRNLGAGLAPQSRGRRRSGCPWPPSHPAFLLYPSFFSQQHHKSAPQNETQCSEVRLCSPTWCTPLRRQRNVVEYPRLGARV